MYMVAKRGARYPLKVTTIRFHEDLDDFIRQCHIDYINWCAKMNGSKHASAQKIVAHNKFGDYLSGWFSGRWIVYECKPTEINKRTGKTKPPENLGGKKLAELAKNLGYNVDA